MKNNLSIILFATFLSFFSVLSFANTDSSQDNTSNQQNINSNSSDSKNSTENNGKEAHILGVIEQIDNNEINAANAAINKTSNSDVKDFAKEMQSDHQKNLADAQDLSKKLNLNLTTSPKAEGLQKKGAAELKNLESKQGSEFDKAYVEAMVKGHTEALNLVNEIISKASNSNFNSDFVGFIKDTQKTISHHLDDAKNLQTKLQK
jgi:putative membrane protein